MPVLEQLPVMVFCTSKDGKHIYFNKEWLAFAGSELEQEIDSGWKERVHSSDYDSLMVQYSLALKSKSLFKHVYRMLNYQGKYKTIETIAGPIFDPSGEFLGYIGLSYDLAEKAIRAEELLESELLYTSLFHNNSEVILLIDPSNGDIVDANPAACSFYGYSKDELLKMKIKDINVLPEKEILAAMQTVGFEKPKVFSFKHRLANDTIRDVEAFASFVTFKGKPYLFSIIHDVVEKISTQRQLKEAYTQLNQIFNSTADGMRVIDKNFNVIRVNKKLLDMMGVTKEEVLGKKCYELFPNPNCNSPTCLLNLIKDGKEFIEYEANLPRADGQLVNCSIAATPFKDTDGNLIGILESVRDVTKRKKYEEQINFLAYHDHLTGLPNRLYFTKALEREIDRAVKSKEKIAVLFLDLDEFKSVNDSLGHSAGDQLLREVGRRLLSVTRNIDGISRTGGDEFIIYLSNTKNAEEVKKVAERILAAIRQPFEINCQEIAISASIGISIFPDNGSDAENLIKKADNSMYWVKEQGKNSFAFYTAELNKSMLNRRKLINNLKKALEKDEFVLYYQPQYHARTQKIVSLEALVRWKHPELGLIMPRDFITLAEETGLITALGEKVLLTACRQMKEWQNKGIAPKRLAVNISTCQLKQHDLVKRVKNVLLETQISPEYLELEITESFAMEGSHLSVLHQLKALGVRIALDDFGTGYSSLSCLSSSPIDLIKIDRSFITQLTNDNNRAIVSAIIAMACTLGMEVLAEGVETSAQFAFLRKTNCRFVQGYFFSKPLPAEKIENILFKEKERSMANIRNFI